MVLVRWLLRHWCEPLD